MLEARSSAAQGTGAGHDPEVFLANLDRRYRRPLIAYFERRIREACDVDDLVQEVFIRLDRRLRQESVAYLEGYVFQTAANVIRDRLRRRLTRRTSQHDPIEGAALPSDDFSPERVLQGRELLLRALEALQELPARTRQVFVLCRYEEMRQDEVAAHLGLSVSGVRFLLRQAKAHLTRRLEQDA
jgi:RNA polymerase sigma factor (sigma-70 family)